jgi:hypothetical protein
MNRMLRAALVAVSFASIGPAYAGRVRALWRTPGLPRFPARLPNRRLRILRRSQLHGTLRRRAPTGCGYFRLSGSTSPSKHPACGRR